MNNKIKCPNCGFEFDVDEVLQHQAEEKVKREYELKLSEQTISFNNQKKEIEIEKQAIEKTKTEQEEYIKKKVAEQTSILKQEAEKNAKKESEEELEVLRKENEIKNKENREFKKKQIELLQKESQLKDKEEDLKLEMQKQMLEKEEEIKEKARLAEQGKNELKFKEYQKKLDDQKKLIDEMKKKSEQGSIQLQGEVQELAIEEWLKKNFALDVIEEIKKGVRGADCLQIINTSRSQNCGSIYYESKRTKDFKVSWIEKFKNDMREKGATLGVLVTDILPKGMERLNQIDGIWICTFEEFKSLCFVLRESVILYNNAIVSQENKGDKMVMLYDYLTSNEFKMQVEAIVGGFKQMQIDLDSEKRAMDGIWKKREKQIQKVMLNTNYMYNSFKGIAGNAISPINALELHESDE